MSGTGPVEPVDSPETEDSYDVIGVDGPRLTDRWTAHWAGLPARTRKTTLATGVITAIAAAVLVPHALTPDHTDTLENPVPWPANVTAWHYLDSAPPAGSQATSGRFRFAVSVHNGPPVTVRVIGAAFTGLTAHATPEPDFTVRAGTTRRITVEISVSDCSDLPLNAHLPFLDVTLRNTRAIQPHSFIFGDAYARDLSELLHGACNPAPARPAPSPIGSAGSQNAD